MRFIYVPYNESNYFKSFKTKQGILNIEARKNKYNQNTRISVGIWLYETRRNLKVLKIRFKNLILYTDAMKDNGSGITLADKQIKYVSWTVQGLVSKGGSV